MESYTDRQVLQYSILQTVVQILGCKIALIQDQHLFSGIYNVIFLKIGINNYKEFVMPEETLGLFIILLIKKVGHLFSFIARW